MTKEKVGVVGVDAGIVWLGDPCYIMHKKKLPKTVGKDWEEFCNILGGEYPVRKQFNYELGHPGLGVVVGSGIGDGVYPVYADVEEVPGWGKRVTKVWIDFFPK